jgi:uncharacterized protein (DUF427 family)
MATVLSSLMRQHLGDLRIEPTSKRVRATLGGATVLDSRRALLVWEPRRVVPTYAVPTEDLRGRLSGSDAPAPDPASAAHRVWDPRIPFAVRTTPGHAVVLASPAGGSIEGFVADDPDLEGYVIVDFAGPDRWREDEDEIISHPHDPYSRIDIRTSRQHLELSLDGELLAASDRPRVLYETGLPPRFYLARDDVVAQLRPSPTVTWCSYKGHATYYSPVVAGEPVADLAWSYRHPLVDAEDVQGMVAFFDEKLDVTVDGMLRPRPTTPWS